MAGRLSPKNGNQKNEKHMPGPLCRARGGSFQRRPKLNFIDTTMVQEPLGDLIRLRTKLSKDMAPDVFAIPQKLI